MNMLNVHNSALNFKKKKTYASAFIFFEIKQNVKEMTLLIGN